MSRFTVSLRKKIRDSGRDVKSIATASGVSYDKLRRYLKGKTKFISVEDYDKVKKLLTGEGVEP